MTVIVVWSRKNGFAPGRVDAMSFAPTECRPEHAVERSSYPSNNCATTAQTSLSITIHSACFKGDHNRVQTLQHASFPSNPHSGSSSSRIDRVVLCIPKKAALFPSTDSRDRCPRRLQPSAGMASETGFFPTSVRALLLATGLAA
jgi:hypothetical protein